MEVGGVFLNRSNIPHSVCQSGPTRTRGLRVYRSVLEQCGEKYVQQNKKRSRGTNSRPPASDTNLEGLH
jgi:hypothetical protein